MSTERLRKFIADQEEAVEVARSTRTSDPLRKEALDFALYIAGSNKEYREVTVEAVLKDAAALEAYLRGE